MLLLPVRVFKLDTSSVTFFFRVADRLARVASITELLVDVVDVVLNGSGIDEKFLGLTLFALVPNTTEFLNAVSFAMNGNIALRYVLAFFLSNGRILFFFCERGLSEDTHTVWKSVQRTPFKFAFYRSQRWSPFRHGMILLRWARAQTLLRVSFIPFL
jgi:hypothetical protein